MTAVAKNYVKHLKKIYGSDLCCFNSISLKKSFRLVNSNFDICQ